LIRELEKKSIFKKPAKYNQTRKIKRITTNGAINFNPSAKRLSTDYDDTNIKDENVIFIF